MKSKIRLKESKTILQLKSGERKKNENNEEERK